RAWYSAPQAQRKRTPDTLRESMVAGAPAGGGDGVELAGPTGADDPGGRGVAAGGGTAGGRGAGGGAVGGSAAGPCSTVGAASPSAGRWSIVFGAVRCPGTVSSFLHEIHWTRRPA